MQFYSSDNINRRIADAMHLVEHASEPVVALARHYPSGLHIALHKHSRTQLLYASSGVALVTTERGRWMIPPDHALLIPRGVEHKVEMFSAVEMQSVYMCDYDSGDYPLVLSVNELTRSLLGEAVQLQMPDSRDERSGLLFALLLHEIKRLPIRELGLPFPQKPALVDLCKAFLLTPDPAASIDQWAEKMSMSRRSFTRLFRAQTGVSFVTWRQQACIFASLPKLASGEAITSVAFDIGYESAAAYTTMFKRMLGSSPRDYMRQQAGYMD
ncbi:AraC family transcriptional regulator [Pseudochrobactrum sp. MP213Fo]|uniref:AraC family transcriptional regulator n=1 Tax=Pseudochrobactrum sp. MP213Fo TaxID=3022250 RepID=UPI003BA25E64